MSQFASLSQSEQAKRANLAAWWATQFIEEILPSGLPVTLRNMDLEDFILNGDVPNTLMSEFIASAESKESEAVVGARLLSSHSSDFMTFLNVVTKACIVFPAIGEITDITSGVISLRDINMKDKLWLFEWANRQTKQVVPFRTEPANDAPVLQPSGDLPLSAQ